MRCVQDDRHQAERQNADDDHRADPAEVDPADGTPVDCSGITIGETHPEHRTRYAHRSGDWSRQCQRTLARTSSPKKLFRTGDAVLQRASLRQYVQQEGQVRDKPGKPE